MKKILPLVFISSMMTATMVSCGSKSTQQTKQTASIEVAYPETRDSVIVHKVFPGYLGADKDLKIVARVSGYVTGKYFTDGDFVRKGQKLFSIEDTQYADAVRQAESQLNTAIATSNYATSQYKAMKKAYESDAVSQMDVIQAESDMNKALADIENAKAALRTARTTLGYCTITALADGHIAAPAVSVGDYVNGSGSPVVLTTIYDDAYVSAVFSIDEGEYIRMKRAIGAGTIDYRNVPVNFTEHLGHEYTGELSYIAPDVNLQTGSVTVKVKIPNVYGELKNGMYAEISLPDEQVKNALLVSDASIGTDQLGKYVYVVNDSNRVVYTPISVGPTVDDTLRIVTKGLSTKDRYVTKAIMKVHDGESVNPQF